MSSLFRFSLYYSKKSYLRYISFSVCPICAIRKLMEQAIDYVDDVEKSLEEKNIQELIAQALEQLSPRQREIFELSRNRGLSHKEIAEQLGLSVYTVQDHIKMH